MTLVLIAACALACAALLASERAGSRAGIWLSKPVAAAAFVGVGISVGAFESAYGRWILLGLCLSWFGDVLLIPDHRPKLFLAGIGGFLAAHVAYCAAFLGAGMRPRRMPLQEPIGPRNADARAGEVGGEDWQRPYNQCSYPSLWAVWTSEMTRSLT